MNFHIARASAKKCRFRDEASPAVASGKAEERNFERSKLASFVVGR